MRNARLLAGLLLLLAPVAAWAGGPGSTGANGTKLSAGARPEGMGGAYTGVADDLSSLFWNPAGLARIERPAGSLMHTAYLADTSYEVLAFGLPVGPIGTVAAAVNMLNYGTFPKVQGKTPSSLLGNLAPLDTFVTAGWGTAMPPLFGLEHVKAGVNLKLTFQQLSQATETGIAFGGGLQWDTPVEGLRTGLSVDNVGSLVTIGGMLPLNMRAGAGYSRALGRNFRGLAAVDTLVQVDTAFHGGIGLEVVGYDIVAVRGGWRGGGAEGGPTFGLGFGREFVILGRKQRLQLDYALTSHGLLGVDHRVQLSFIVGEVAIKPMGPLAIEGEGAAAHLAWTGPGPGYLVYVRNEGESNFLPLTDRPIPETTFPAGGLPPAKYRFKVAVADPAKPGWTGSSREVDYTVLPPPPPLELAITGVGDNAWLKWRNGIGPAYDIYAVQRGNPEPVRLNERSVGVPEFLLTGIPPGEYTFRVHTVDSARPAWLGPVSNETQLILEAPAQAVVAELKKFQVELGKIQFATARATIDPVSDPILEAAADIMRKYPEFKVRVEGHTDNAGGSGSNKRLSQARAEAVVRYLVERKGIDKARLSAAGFGDARPIADNTTETGRATNRRVEFVVINLEEAH